MALQALVKCRHCRQTKWVKWDHRHDGKDPRAEHHKEVRCDACQTGFDRTEYQGILKGEVESKGQSS